MTSYKLLLGYGFVVAPFPSLPFQMQDVYEALLISYRIHQSVFGLVSCPFLKWGIIQYLEEFVVFDVYIPFVSPIEMVHRNGITFLPTYDGCIEENLSLLSNRYISRRNILRRLDQHHHGYIHSIDYHYISEEIRIEVENIEKISDLCEMWSHFESR